MKSSGLLHVLTLALGAILCIGLLSASVTQEVPRGTLHGVLKMKENGKTLPKAFVTVKFLGLSNVDDPKSRQYRYFEVDDGDFTIRNVPSGVYLVQADATAHDMKQQAIMVEEGKVTDMTLVLKPKDPSLDLYASQRVFTPGEAPSFELHGFDPSAKAAITYYKLNLSDIVKKGGLSTLLYSFSRPGNQGGADPSKSSISSDGFERPLQKDVEGVFSQYVNLPKLDEGFYYVRAVVGKNSRATYLNVSKIGLVTKTAGPESLCFVTDLKTGEPARGVIIEAPGPSGLTQVATTGPDGLARVTVPAGSEHKALLVARRGASQAIVDFDNQSSSNDGMARLFVYTDRPIYRPGDEVQFKGIVRRLKTGAYELPNGGHADIEIRDTDETTIQKFQLPVDARGTFHGNFKTNAEDKPGAYSIKATYDGAEYTYWVSIAAYRKPEFSITVTPTQPYFFYGNKASATVKAEYYFGGPVVGAKVAAYITRSPIYRTDDGDADYDSDSGYDPQGGYYSREFQGEYTEQVDAVTNEKGEAVITFPTKKDGDPDVPDTDLNFSVNASITDASNKYFDGSGDVKIVRGDVDANLQVDHYVADIGDTILAQVKVTTQVGDNPVPGKPVSLEVGFEKWTGGTEAQYVPKRTLTGTTDANGVAQIPIKVESEGSMVLHSTVLDSANRAVKSTETVYIEGDNFYGPPDQQFTVTLDKRHYKIGDTCKVMIETDKPGGSALVTVQAEKVLATYVVNLSKRATVLQIPVKHDYQPNVWVSAVAVKNKHLLEAESRLTVNTAEHDLKVAISSDKPAYLPGETAALTIKTTDASGRPVPADLSVGVVDESIYAIKPDSTNIKQGFYPMREDSVRTNYSFEEIYLDGGDKAGGNIPVRSQFKDTAAWQPNVLTDARGIGHTTVKLPDNLTSWRATAIGVSAATQVGMSHLNFRARKPLMVRLELPGFLVQSDSQQITTIVTNDTGEDRDVNLRLDVQGVTVDGETGKKVHVSASKPLAVTWMIGASQTGPARFTVYAQSDGGINDAEERTIQVEPHGRLTIESHAGELKSGVSTIFTLAPSADPNTGRLKLSITPSVGASIYQSLDDLIGYPYGCVEQTMSRFLPAVVLQSTLKDLHIRSDLQGKIPDIVADGFARLAKMQHSNGAWGWWEYDDADPFMTAYVLDGLKRAKAAGYSTNKIDTDRAISWARGELAETKPDGSNAYPLLYLAYAASAYGEKDVVAKAIEKITPRGAAEVALMAMIHSQLGDKAASQRDLAQLHQMMINEGSLTHFKANPWAYGAESSAFPLIALTALMPQDPYIPRLIRTMELNRFGDMWTSTRDTSLALIGLTEYMRTTHDRASPADISVSVNGTIHRLHFDPMNLTSKLQIEVPVSDLRKGENRIEFQTTGTGAAFFSGELRQVVVEDRLLPLRSEGLGIQRNYYLLEPQRMESGQLELRPSKRSIDQARSGDLVRVELTIESDRDREFIMVEDPIPSGCRITDREYVDEGEEWTNWWSQIIIRDDKAAFFMRYLPKGTQKLTYTMRAEQIGVGHALPPVLSNMYDPTQTASGGETILRVTP